MSDKGRPIQIRIWNTDMELINKNLTTIFVLILWIVIVGSIVKYAQKNENRLNIPALEGGQGINPSCSNATDRKIVMNGNGRTLIRIENNWNGINWKIRAPFIICDV